MLPKSEKRGRYEYSGPPEQEKYNYKSLINPICEHFLLENLKVAGLAELDGVTFQF